MVSDERKCQRVYELVEYSGITLRFSIRVPLVLPAFSGHTVWTGPVQTVSIYGSVNENMPRHIIIATWKSMKVIYGECCAMMLVYESIIDDHFGILPSSSGSQRYSSLL